MTLTSQARADLVTALQPHVAAIAEDLRKRLLNPGPADVAGKAAAVRLHADERAGDRFEVWADLLSRRAAVLWILKLVYVRVLEDRGLIARRLTNALHRQLFERLAPSLGESAYARWVFADLAQERGGLPELFAVEPAEVLAPAHAHTAALLDLLCGTDPDSGARRFDFTGERFDGQLLGDLYQELDPVVKERFALLQTPDFVRAFLLDRTLSEALKEWPADEVRVYDPACGSGHFLIDAFRRLVTATTAARPAWSTRQVVDSALSRVVGVDLNDYAAALARARLLMTAVELLGDDLSAAAGLRPQVFWADGLEQIERDDTIVGSQLSLGQDPALVPRAVLTPSATRAELRPLLTAGFHVVVANPPYITEKDAARKAYHKEKVGIPPKPRYVSAASQYSLGAPFTERAFQITVPGGFVGFITSNSFAKREFGVPCVEKVLKKQDVTLLVDTSGAYIPGHGTPTILILARRRKPTSDTITAVLGKRGEPSNPDDASTGKVWTSILAGWATPGFDSPFVSTEAVPRSTFAGHPWSLRGGGALALQSRIESRRVETVGEIGQGGDGGGTTIGGAVRIGADQVFLRTRESLRRTGFPERVIADAVRGENVRDWAFYPEDAVLCPYPVVLVTDPVGVAPFEDAFKATIPLLWRWRSTLEDRATFQGKMADAGLPWFEYMQFTSNTYRARLGITFAFVATHNHFVLDRGGKVFNRTAPVVKLPAGATEDDHLALLGPLNSSTACFWMKQVCFDKGNGGIGGGIGDEGWEPRFEFDSTKLARFPLPPDREATLPWARALDALGHARAADTVGALLDGNEWYDGPSLVHALDARALRDLDRLRQMVALQEELDWLCYRLYGLVDAGLPVVHPEGTPPITPGWRPFEIALARRDVAVRAAVAAGRDADDTPTAWFDRHGWDAHTDLPKDLDPSTAERFAMRMAATERDPALQLLEAPVHKRRWYRPNREEEERDALRAWLLDRVEDALKRADSPQTPGQLARRLAGDRRVEAVAHRLAPRTDLGTLLAERMAQDAVAAWPPYRYTAKGLVKRRAWEHTWELQAAEDRGVKVKIRVPPSYTGVDFVGSVAYPLRGKLDVPKERFVAHTEVPDAHGERRTGTEALYGWAGWTRKERLERLFALLGDLDDQGVAHAHRLAVHDLMFRYLDELGRTEPQQASTLRADLVGESKGPRPTEHQLAAWLAAHPATSGRGRARSSG